MPLLSETPTSPAPAASRILDTTIPEAPAPQTTTRIADRSLPTTRAAPRSAASATIAVPCWSSCMTGMSSMARSRSSISKQRLALHDGHRRGRPDIAEAEHGGAVAHHGDGVADPGVIAGQLGLIGDRA